MNSFSPCSQSPDSDKLLHINKVMFKNKLHKLAKDYVAKTYIGLTSLDF